MAEKPHSMMTLLCGMSSTSRTGEIRTLGPPIKTTTYFPSKRYKPLCHGSKFYLLATASTRTIFTEGTVLLKVGLGNFKRKIQESNLRPEGGGELATRFMTIHYYFPQGYGEIRTHGGCFKHPHSLSRGAPSANSATYPLEEEVGFEPTDPFQDHWFSRPEP